MGRGGATSEKGHTGFVQLTSAFSGENFGLCIVPAFSGGNFGFVQRTSALFRCFSQQGTNIENCTLQQKRHRKKGTFGCTPWIRPWNIPSAHYSRKLQRAKVPKT
jgi:hypothetical protein